LNKIEFYSEIPEYQFNKNVIARKWLKFVAESEKKQILDLEYFFVSESKITEINHKHLNHNYKTDIITFNYSFLTYITGEIYICIPVVINNSKIYSINNFEIELWRIIIHGLLHLIGYNDLSNSEKLVMRKTENLYLEYFDRI